MPANPDLIKRLAELVDGDGWEIADLLAEQFPASEFGEGSKANSALYNALDECEDALRQEHGILELKVSTMRNYRATSIAWPHAERSACAPFLVHTLVRGPDREAQMASYLRRNKGLPLSVRHVRRYRSDDNPKTPRSWDAAMRKAIESAAKRHLLAGIIPEPGTDWWKASTITDEARDAVIAALRDLTNEIAS